MYFNYYFEVLTNRENITCNKSKCTRVLKWDKERRDNYALLDMKIQFDAILRNINEAGCDINIVINDFSALLNEISFDRFGRTYYATMDKRYTQSP